MENNLPFTIQYKNSLPKEKVIAFIIATIFLDFIVALTIGMHQIGPKDNVSNWYFIFLLIPVFVLLFGIVFFTKVNKIILSLDEYGLTCKSFLDYRRVSYLDILKIEHKQFANASMYSKRITTIPSYLPVMTFTFKDGKSFSVNPLVFDNQKLATFLKIISEKNPDIAIDKDTSALKTAITEAYMKSKNRNVLIILLIGLIGFSLYTILPKHGGGAVSVFSIDDNSKYLAIGGIVLLFVIIIFTLFRQNKNNK